MRYVALLCVAVGMQYVDFGEAMIDTMQRTLFDAYVEEYEQACARGLAYSGESREYFVEQRARHTAKLVEKHGPTVVNGVLDFGCGVGLSLPVLGRHFPGASLTGVDVSQRAIQFAKQQYASSSYRFAVVEDLSPEPRFDVVYCNGVFHHIPIDERAQAVDYIYRSLIAGGVVALWENNPWNPGTRWVMKHISFDRDAVMLSSRTAVKLLRAGGFRILETRSYFYFPHLLAPLRFFEPTLEAIPLGAQFVTLAQKV